MKTPNYFITFLSSAAYVGYKISQSIQYKLTKKAEREAAIDATAVNKINRGGKSTAPVPPIKGLSHLRERNYLLLKLKLLYNRTRYNFLLCLSNF